MAQGSFRLTTWNCSPWRLSEKLARLDALSSDLVVLPEASQPKAPIERFTWFGGKPVKGVAIRHTARFTLEELPVLPSALWSVRPLRVRGTPSFTLLACWARVPPGYLRSVESALDEYGPILRDGPLVVAGDFNANPVFDRPRAKRSFARLAARLHDEFGLVSAYHQWFGEAYGSETRPTHFFQWQEHNGFHIDYCFVPETWRIVSAEVGGFADWGSLSDHAPLTVDVRS